MYKIIGQLKLGLIMINKEHEQNTFNKCYTCLYSNLTLTSLLLTTQLAD